MKIYKLCIPKPKIIYYPNKSLPANIWLNKKNIYRKTYKNDKTKLLNKPNLPHGLKIYKIKEPKMNSMNILNKMFNTFDKSNYGEDYVIFEKFNPSKNKPNIRLSLFEVLKLVKNNPEYIKFIMFYVNKILKIFNISKTKNVELYKKILNETKFSILHYKGNSGLHCHIDNTSGNTGPIITIGIGSSYNYDILPVFYTKKELDKLNPLRIKMKNNYLTIMDGEMRYCWTHCIPYGYKRKIDKYTLKFILPILGKYNKKNNKLLNSYFTTSYK